MNEIWCVFQYDSDGSCDSPIFFRSRDEAASYISDAAIEEYDRIEGYPDSTIEVNCNTDLYAQIGTDKISQIWRGFEITDYIADITLMAFIERKGNKNV